ncbi:TPA: STY1053 family phage-associated protein [Klebsiella oxytoca]
MKYLVNSGATLSLGDGSKFEITKGVHSGADFPESVKSHWAFASYAKQIDDAEADKLEAANADLKAYVASLETANASLLAQIGEKDKEIADLKAAAAKPEDKPVTGEEKQETGNAKKQSSSNK